MPAITNQILLSTHAAQKCLETLNRKLNTDQARQIQFLSLSGSNPAQNGVFLLGNALALQRASKGLLLPTLFLLLVPSFYVTLTTYLVEYDVEFILSLLGLCKQNKGYDSFLTAQLSCLYSPETVLSFFGKLGSSQPPPEELESSTYTDTTSHKSRRHHFTSSIFSYFGLSSSTTSREGNKYSVVPLEDLSIKDPATTTDLIDIDRLVNIAEISFYDFLAERG